MITYNAVEPLDIDHMPVEVATEMLVAPRAKLSARQRKTCMAARQKVFWTGNPLYRRYPELDPDRTVMHRGRLGRVRRVPKREYPLCEDADPVIKTPQQKLAAKFRALPLDRLGRVRRRAEARRRGVQRLFEKMRPSFEQLDSHASHLSKAQIVWIMKIRHELEQRAGALNLIIAEANNELALRGRV